jgi:hypothetical protein
LTNELIGRKINVAALNLSAETSSILNIAKFIQNGQSENFIVWKLLIAINLNKTRNSEKSAGFVIKKRRNCGNFLNDLWTRKGVTIWRRKVIIFNLLTHTNL